MERAEAEAIYRQGEQACVEVMLGLAAAVERLEGRVAELEARLKLEARRFVVFFRNRPQAVLLHVDEYERLVREAERPAPAAAA